MNFFVDWLCFPLNDCEEHNGLNECSGKQNTKATFNPHIRQIRQSQNLKS